jgi:hypothetical protein
MKHPCPKHRANQNVRIEHNIINACAFDFPGALY